MNELLKQAWQLNIEFSLLLLVILLLRYAVRNTVKNYNAYLLWLSIPLSFLAAVCISFFSFSEPPAAAMSVVVHYYFLEPVETINYGEYIAYGWCVVSFILLLRLIVQHWLLRQTLHLIECETGQDLVSNYPIALVDEEDFSPSIYGFLETKIYFPMQLLNQLSEEQITLIIQHEEHHIKQQHLWLNLLWDIAVCLIWFNPLVYFARRSFRHDQELFCDYLVLKESSKRAQQAYGMALLSSTSRTGSISLMCSWKAFNQLEERIMNIKKTSSRRGKLMLLVCGMSIIGTTLLYAASTDEPPKHPFTVYLSEDGRLRIFEDGIHRLPTELEEEEWKETAAELAAKDTALDQSELGVSKSFKQDARKTAFFIKEFGINAGYALNCAEFEYFDDDGQSISYLDQCTIKQGEKEHEFTPEQMEAYRGIVNSIEVDEK